MQAIICKPYQVFNAHAMNISISLIDKHKLAFCVFDKNCVWIGIKDSSEKLFLLFECFLCQLAFGDVSTHTKDLTDLTITGKNWLFDGLKPAHFSFWSGEILFWNELLL